MCKGRHQRASHDGRVLRGGDGHDEGAAPPPHLRGGQGRRRRRAQRGESGLGRPTARGGLGRAAALLPAAVLVAWHFFLALRRSGASCARWAGLGPGHHRPAGRRRPTESRRCGAQQARGEGAPRRAGETGPRWWPTKCAGLERAAAAAPAPAAPAARRLLRFGLGLVPWPCTSRRCRGRPWPPRSRLHRWRQRRPQHGKQPRAPPPRRRRRRRCRGTRYHRCRRRHQQQQASGSVAGPPPGPPPQRLAARRSRRRTATAGTIVGVLDGIGLARTTISSWAGRGRQPAFCGLGIRCCLVVVIVIVGVSAAGGRLDGAAQRRGDGLVAGHPQSAFRRRCRRPAAAAAAFPRGYRGAEGRLTSHCHPTLGRRGGFLRRPPPPPPPPLRRWWARAAAAAR